MLDSKSNQHATRFLQQAQQYTKVAIDISSVVETQLHIGLTWNKAYPIANQ